jgi:hypothetical protein
MPQSLLALIVIVALTALCVRAIAWLSPGVDLRILPVRRRRRVQWCTAKVHQVELAAAGLVTALVALHVAIQTGTAAF